MQLIGLFVTGYFLIGALYTMWFYRRHDIEEVIEIVEGEFNFSPSKDLIKVFHTLVFPFFVYLEMEHFFSRRSRAIKVGNLCEDYMENMTLLQQQVFAAKVERLVDEVDFTRPGFFEKLEEDIEQQAKDVKQYYPEIDPSEPYNSGPIDYLDGKALMWLVNGDISLDQFHHMIKRNSNMREKV